MGKSGPSLKDACLGESPALIFIYVYTCLFCGHLLHMFGTRSLHHIAGFMPVNWQPNVCSCVWRTSLFPFLSPREPSAARHMGMVCRTQGLLRKEASHFQQNFVTDFEGAETVPVPVSSVLNFIHSLNGRKPGRWEKT